MTEEQKEAEQEVLECKLNVENAEKEVQDAKDWHYQQLLWYAEAIIRRDKLK